MVLAYSMCNIAIKVKHALPIEAINTGTVSALLTSFATPLCILVIAISGAILTIFTVMRMIDIIESLNEENWYKIMKKNSKTPKMYDGVYLIL